MKKVFGIMKPRKSLLIASVFAPVCFGMLVVGVTPSGWHDLEPARLQSPSASDIKIINTTTTLDATFEITVDNHLLLRLRNISARDLNGYVVAVNGGRITADISSGDRVIPSGQTSELEIPVRSSSMTLTVLAAMFADGSIEAEPVLKSELSEWRLGLKKELVRGLKVLDEMLDSPDVNTTKALDRLDSRLSLPLDSDTSHSYSDSGTRDARNSFNSAIHSLRERQQRHGSLMQRQRLLDLKGRIERRIASL
jgi:hypothetical protein